jgi:glutathione S-transferase
LEPRRERDSLSFHHHKAMPMLQLYYTPGACSLASHIVLRETGLDFGLIRVDLATGKTEQGEDFRAINPKGYVPALRLDDGELLTENQVILQFLADRCPGAGLAPAAGTLPRYRLMEWLAFIATELHKGFGPLWNPATPEATRQVVLAQLAMRFDFVEAALNQREGLTDAPFSLADAYLFTVLGWASIHRIDLTPWPNLREFRQRIIVRPAVQAALKAEGLAA